MANKDNILEVHGLKVSFRVVDKISHVIDGLDFTLKRGERIGLVGESGCGKTTTLKAILGVLPGNAISDGEILYEGKNVRSMSKDELLNLRRRGAGMIFQDPSSALNPVFTIKDQFYTAVQAAESEKLDKKVLYERSVDALNAVSLPDPDRILDNYPFQLSGGMRQRVCIALTLAAGKSILLADEPGTALDVTIQDQILRLINRLVEEKGLSVVMVSHSLGVIRESTSYVNIMYAGTIVESGGTNIVFEDPKHPYTRALMACIPKLTGDGIAEGIPGRIPDYLNPPKGCRFSPRCPYATEKCRNEKPPRIETGGNHWVKCFHPQGVI